MAKGKWLTKEEKEQRAYEHLKAVRNKEECVALRNEITRELKGCRDKDFLINILSQVKVHGHG